MLSPSRRLRILLVLLLTLTVLGSPGAWARGGPAGRNEPAKVSKPSSPNILSRAWTLLTAFWNKTGCGIDPDGHCVTAPAALVPEPVDTGCGINPNGRCHS